MSVSLFWLPLLVSVLALGVRAAAHLLWCFSVLFALLCITSVAEVLCLLFLLLLWVLSALAAPPCCVSSANLGTPAVSTRCLAAGCPSGVPLLLLFSEWQTVREALLFSYVFMVVGAS